MDKSKYGVHQTHCCIIHGCKYGDEDCPVVSGEIKQAYPCEYCSDENEENYIARELYATLKELRDCSGQAFTDEQQERKFVAIATAENVLDKYKLIFGSK